MIIDLNKVIITCVACRSILTFDNTSVKHISVDEELKVLSFDDEIKRCPHCNTNELTVIDKV